jgi:phospholipid/cholesterol/gamma-HCH transport system substrate-binding protein
MKRIYNNYFLVGLFTIMIGGTAIFLLLKMSGKGEEADRYYSYFNNVTGLGHGNPVYYEGYRVGQVEDITPETIDGKLLFKTEYTILRGWKVPSDSFTKIASSGLLSDMSLSINAGKKTSILKIGSEIRGVAGDDIMATVTQLADDFSRLNEEKITPLIDLIYERVDNLSLSLETQIPEILTSIDVLVKDLNKLVKSADKLLDEENLAGIDNIIANLEDVSKQMTSLSSWVENSLDKANHLIESGEKLVNNSEVKLGDFLDIAIKMIDGFSIKAESIANEMESASMNMNEATDAIRKNPSSLIFKNKSKVSDEDL